MFLTILFNTLICDLFNWLMKKLIRKRSVNAKNDILSGLTAALALVPEAVAFVFW